MSSPIAVINILAPRPFLFHTWTSEVAILRWNDNPSMSLYLYLIRAEACVYIRLSNLMGGEGREGVMELEEEEQPFWYWDLAPNGDKVLISFCERRKGAREALYCRSFLLYTLLGRSWASVDGPPVGGIHDSTSKIYPLTGFQEWYIPTESISAAVNWSRLQIGLPRRRTFALCFPCVNYLPFNHGRAALGLISWPIRSPWLPCIR